MAAPTYRVTIGSLQASSPARQGNALVRSFLSELTLEGAGGRCSLELVTAERTPPLPGEKTTLSLDAGGGGVPVFTGTVLETRTTSHSTVVVGTDALTQLACLDVSGAYEQMSAGAIVRELVKQAGARAGTVEEGPTFSSYVLHRGPRALRHVQRLAEQCGFDVYTDGQGRVQFAAPRQGRADHTFVYREQVLRACLSVSPPAWSGVSVWGEGAASTHGTQKAHWLAANLDSVRGQASLDGALRVQRGEGSRPREVHEGALRTGDDAATQARARMAARAARPLRGFIESLASPTVRPGDLIQLDGIPPEHPVHALAAGKVLRVRTVRHLLDTRAGLLTRMEF